MAHRITEAIQKALTSIHLSKPSLVSPTPAVPATQKRACVAIIIRVRPANKNASDPDLEFEQPGHVSSPTSPKCGIIEKIQNFFSSSWVRLGSLEIFFIKRAIRPGDRWSGYVAYPGGRQEATDESCLHTVHREVKEEVGIDLTGPNFVHIGQLDDREITTSLGKRMLMVLSPFVFLYTSPEPLIPRLQASEISSAHWVPLSCLLSREARWGEISFDIGSRIAQTSKAAQKVMSVLLGQMHYQSILLPEDPLRSPAFAHICEDTIGMTKKAMERPTLPLWGPGLAISLEFLSHTGLPEYTDSTNAGSHWSKKLDSAIPQRTSENELAVPSMSIIFPTFSSDIDSFVWLFGAKYRSYYKRWIQSRFTSIKENGLQLLDGPDESTDESCLCTAEQGSSNSEQPHFRALTLHHFYAAVRHALILAVLVRSVLFIGILCALPWTHMKKKSKYL